MNRTMSSLNPLGAVSDSISVKKPYLYFCSVTARTCSAVSSVAAMLFSYSPRSPSGPPVINQNVLLYGSVIYGGQRWKRRHRAHIRQSHFFQGAADGAVDLVPVAPHGTQTFHVAMPFGAIDAGRKRYRPVHGADDIGDR